MAWSAGKSSLPVTLRLSGLVWIPWNWMPWSSTTRSQPSSCQKKSKCHHERRNSPSVASCKPTSSCLARTLAISWSSIRCSSAAVIWPFSRLWRASLSVAGRNRLPTMSARNGGVVVGISFSPLGRSMPASIERRRSGWRPFPLGNAQVNLELLGVAGQGSTIAGKYDATAIEYHSPVGEAQDFARLLLHHDGRYPLLTDDLAQHNQELVDDDRRKALQWLVQQDNTRIDDECTANRQHLLLAAGELAAEIVAPLLEPREHAKHAFHRPRPRSRNGGEVLLDGERAEDVALLRRPADTRSYPSLWPLARDIPAIETDATGLVRSKANNGIDQRRLAGAIAAKQRQRLAVRYTEADIGQHHGLAIARPQALYLEKVSHGRPLQDRPDERARRAQLPRADLPRTGRR